jgi:elongation factor P
MKINGNAIRPGNVIEHKGGLWRAVKIAHTQPGKGGAYLQAELRNLRDGSKLNERFRAAENVEKIRLDQQDFQFLFGDGDTFTFMNSESYEQVELNNNMIEEQAPYLQEGMTVQIESFDNEVLGMALPEHITVEILETDPALKGQTAASSFKPAVVDNGIRTNVPPFVNVGDKVVISTEDGSYVKRAD